jgi:hypothetical protein
VKVGLDVTGSRCGPMMEYYEHSNEQALTYWLRVTNSVEQSPSWEAKSALR